MKRPLIIGNWKAHKDVSLVKLWVEDLAQKWPQGEVKAEIVLAPAAIHLAVLSQLLLAKNLPVKLCAQDVSIFPEGAYTGEVTASMLVGLVDYVLVGHSERRKYFNESEEILKKKVEETYRSGLKAIYCISEVGMSIPMGVEIIAYEPLFSIGSGKPDTPKNADFVAGEIKKKYPTPVLYGGSVKPEIAKDFIQMQNLDGLLVGGASLTASDFLAIIQNVA